ncbi:hypothetical protein BN1708_005343 [Verticillium longisporum]|uniref:Uncharacterized protein n=1 Tax=Verticillium longisporum TaxID=100787 RepID=A0A0G4MA34_VERLO|nr:hypothetical protein BN1708_005343 [Verticillium longisporum]
MDHPHRPVEAHMCSRKGRIASLKAHGRFTELVLMSRIHDKRDENTLDNTRTLLDQTWEQVTGPSQTKRFGEAVSQFLLSFFAFLIPGDRGPHFSSPSLKLASTLLSASPQIPRPDGCGPPKLHLDSLVVTFGDLRRQAQATRHQIRRREYPILCSENQHRPRASACCPTTASLGGLAVNTRPTDKDGRAAEGLTLGRRLVYPGQTVAQSSFRGGPKRLTCRIVTVI